MGKILVFISLLGFEAKTDFDKKPSKLKPYLIRSSDRYRNQTNPTHGGETASIFRFSAETFESDFDAASLYGAYQTELLSIILSDFQLNDPVYFR